MPQSSDPYKFTEQGIVVPGIPEAYDDPLIVGGVSATAHNLLSQPKLMDGTVYSSFDDVYMPQPKTRETDYPTNPCVGSDCYGPAGSDTLSDLYRYWPAKRDRNGGIVGTVYTSSINTGPGCLRYQSVNGESSDEGHWNNDEGTHFAHPGHFLGSPAYKVAYYDNPNSNSFLNGFNFTISNYIASFRSRFAKGYFHDCCTNALIEEQFLDQFGKKWGRFGINNIKYGTHYYDEAIWGLGFRV